MYPSVLYIRGIHSRPASFVGDSRLSIDNMVQDRDIECVEMLICLYVIWKRLYIKGIRGTHQAQDKCEDRPHYEIDIESQNKN